ncbi:MAG: heavy-metal-associated domain-containing protein [Clostridia bacterium]|nr:heavy-metal-associated domain-containing protein [Clostridia bacterium]
MIKISVPDMMCEKCAARIEKAVAKTKVDFSVSLADKAVFIDGCEKCAAKAAAAIKDAGYTPAVEA